MISKIIDWVVNPIKIHNFLFRYWSRLLPDRAYLKLVFKRKLGYTLNLDCPLTFNEKLQWLKLYGYKSQYAIMADKYLVKQYVRDVIGDYYVVPLLGVWDDANDIDFAKLPNRFVLKCNHNSGGGMCICKDKTNLDEVSCRMALDRAMKLGYYYQGRDKQYRDIQKKIIADAFLGNNRTGELQDYKFWCFNGVPTFMYITNKGKSIYENFYDMEFNPIDIRHSFPRRTPEYDKPLEFEEMKRIAAVLSKDIPFVRIDFFDVEGHVYFGEFTFFDWGGFMPFDNYDMDLELGQYIQLPAKK